MGRAVLGADTTVAVGSKILGKLITSTVQESRTFPVERMRYIPPFHRLLVALRSTMTAVTFTELSEGNHKLFINGRV